VLVTPAQPGPRESGSGFVVQRDGDTCHVVTCHHVVRDWPRNEVQVNGRPAEVVAHGEKLGIDLAVLSVREIGDAQPLPLKEFARPGTAVYGYSFRHLHGDHYVRARLEARVSALLHLQGRTATRAVEAWQIKAVKKHAIRPGDSGAPLMEAKGRRGGPARATCADGSRRSAARPVRRRGRAGRARARRDPPAGGQGEGALLRGPAGEIDRRHRRAGARALLPPRHLRPRADLGPQARSGGQGDHAAGRLQLRRLPVGCQVRDSGGHWVGLEYDLARLPKLPKVFLER
jgi:hypothetical protein